MNDKEKLKFLKDKFYKVCINALPSGQPYKHPDLYKLSMKAKKQGKDYFYVESYKEGEWLIKYKESKPKFVYKFNSRNRLTIEKYNEIFEGIE